MAVWTQPRTFTTGELISAATLNEFLRDNLLCTAPAIVTAAGDTIFASGPNTLERLPAGAAGQYLRMNPEGGAPTWDNLVWAEDDA